MQKSGKTVRLYTNDYDVQMLEIKTGNRPVFISLKKALAILDTNNDADLIEPVKKHGRDLYKIKYTQGGAFTVGQGKIDAVLDNDSGILLAMNADVQEDELCEA